MLSVSHNDDASGPDGQAGPTVMLVVASQVRHQLVLDLIGQHAAHGTIKVAGSVLEAMLCSYRKPADLLVLDLGVDGPAAPALIRQLARIAPELAVLAFDDIVQPLPGYAYDVWPWSEARVVLGRWLAARRARGTRAGRAIEICTPASPAIDKTKDDK